MIELSAADIEQVRQRVFRSPAFAPSAVFYPVPNPPLIATQAGQVASIATTDVSIGNNTAPGSAGNIPVPAFAAAAILRCSVTSTAVVGTLMRIFAYGDTQATAVITGQVLNVQNFQQVVVALNGGGAFQYNVSRGGADTFNYDIRLVGFLRTP